jgi:hypothetical protein
MQQLEKLAATRKTTVDALVNGEFSKVMEDLLESTAR